MSVLPIKFDVQFDRGHQVSKRAHIEAMREAHRAAGELWHAKMLPKHFTAQAKATYQHQARKPKYIERKKRMALAGKVLLSGVIDNVLHGLTEDALKGFVSVKAFPTRFTLRMSGPSYLSMRPYKSGQPDKAAEITRITATEKKELAAEMRRTYLRRVRELIAAGRVAGRKG